MTPMAPTNASQDQLVGQTFAANDYGGQTASADWYEISTIFIYTEELVANSKMWMALGLGSGDRLPTSLGLTNQLPPSHSEVLKMPETRYAFMLTEPICHVDPSARLAITFPFSAPGPATTGSSQLSIAHSNDEGVTWVHDSKKLNFLIQGKATSVSSNQSVTKSRYNFADLTMQVGDHSAAKIHTGMEITNQPLVTENHWLAKFDVDPRSVDLDASGIADWSSSTFSPSELSSGKWQMEKGAIELQTAGQHNFDSDFTEVNFVCRSIENDIPDGVAFAIPWNRKELECNGVMVQVGKDANGLQAVRLFNGKSNTDTLLTAVRDLPDRLLNIRMMFLKQQNKVVLWIDSRYLGSYDLEATGWSDEYASLTAVSYTHLTLPTICSV